MDNYMSLKDHVYNYIAEEINKGTLAPEEKINEQRICEILNISRTPVREALIQLASEGFLENVPRKGFIIRGLSEKEAEEIYSIVGVLDGLAASLACEYITEKEIKDMEFYIAGMNLAIESENYDMYYKQQEEFHQVYLDICRNANLIELLIKTKKKFLKKSYVMGSGDSMQDVFHSTNKEHGEILTLFKNRDRQGLEKYLKEVHWNPRMAYMERL